MPVDRGLGPIHNMGRVLPVEGRKFQGVAAQMLGVSCPSWG